MLGIVSMAGNALKAFGNTHPAVKWGVIVLAFLLAAEFVGKEGLSLYRDMATVQATVQRTNVDTQTAVAQSCAAKTHFYDPADPNWRQMRDYDKEHYPECFVDPATTPAPTMPATSEPHPFPDRIETFFLGLLLGAWAGAFEAGIRYRRWRNALLAAKNADDQERAGVLTP